MWTYARFRGLPLLIATGLLLLGIIAGMFSLRLDAVHAQQRDDVGGTSYGSLSVVRSTAIALAAGATGPGQQMLAQQDLTPKTASASAAANSDSPVPPTASPRPPARAVTSYKKSAAGFDGLTHASQRNAGTDAYSNTQYNLEAPDPGLCVGHGFVLEVVNSAVAVYSAQGKLLAGVAPLNQFFGLAPAITRTTLSYGALVSHPQCLYDGLSERWFLSAMQVERDGASGSNSGPSHTLLAVSATNDPTGGWTVLSLDTTDDGRHGTPAHAGCPCFADQPSISADHAGFYLTTNEFSTATTAFNGAQVYAISMHKLINTPSAAGNAVTFVHINAANLLVAYGGVAYGLQPARSQIHSSGSEDAQNQQRLHGIAYFMSALQFGAAPYEILDNRIAIWGLINTEALSTDVAMPALALQVKVIGSETYGQPNPAQQKAGPTPLRAALGDKDPFEQINTNDDRMNQVVFAADTLWGAVNTIIGDGTTTGIAYFRVHPYWSWDGNLGAYISSQDYVAVRGNSAIFPAVAVNTAGVGMLAFTLVGPDYYPALAYVQIGGQSTSSAVHIARAGVAPEDGFSGYPSAGAADAFARWGGYSAAVVAEDNSIWITGEYISPAPRTLLANWGTFIAHISPDNAA